MAAGPCPHCGYENRQARRWCKQCREPLDTQPVEPATATSAVVAQPVRRGGFETRVKSYTSPGAFNRDAAQMASDGWEVVSTTERRPRIGCVRIILTGFLALLFPPKPEIVVTYRRERR